MMIPSPPPPKRMNLFCLSKDTQTIQLSLCVIFERGTTLSNQFCTSSTFFFEFDFLSSMRIFFLVMFPLQDNRSVMDYSFPIPLKELSKLCVLLLMFTASQHSLLNEFGIWCVRHINHNFFGCFCESYSKFNYCYCFQLLRTYVST